MRVLVVIVNEVMKKTLDMLNTIQKDNESLDKDKTKLDNLRVGELEYTENRYQKYYSPDMNMKRIIRRTFNRQSLNTDTIEMVVGV